MANVVRNARISCEEDNIQPLKFHNRIFNLKILEVREASQTEIISRLDNTTANGATGFQTLENLVKDLGKAGGVSSQ